MRNTLALLMTLSALAACSKADDAPMTEDQFCEEYAKRECEAVAPLCTFAVSACTPTRISQCHARITVWRTATGGSRPFRAENAEVCLDKVKSVYASVPISGAVLHTLQETCARVFQGTTKVSLPCSVDLDCDGNLICDPKVKVCADKKPVAAGSFCGNPGEVCGAGEWCKAGAAGGVLQCAKRQAAGQACSTADPCVESLRCTGTCVERVPSGSTCLQDDDCSTGYCSPYLQKCGAGLNFADESPSCKEYAGAAVGDAGTASD
jgi:hypothetical protein